MAPFREWLNGSWKWDLVWRKGLFDWEKTKELQLLYVLNGLCLVLDKKDCWVWKGGMTIGYTVSLAYSVLIGSSGIVCLPMFESFWKILAIPSVHFTTWRVLGNTIASKANMLRRGVVVDCMFCCLYGETEETTRHLFFECRFACLVWNQCYTWFVVTSIDHIDLVSHFLHFKLCNVPNYINVFWGSV